MEQKFKIIENSKAKEESKVEMNMTAESSPANQKVLAEKLNAYLANLYASFLKTQNYHWNVKGPHFFSIHKMLEEQYEEQYAMIDELAERITTMGFVANGSLKTFSESSNINEASEVLNSQKMLEELVQSQIKLVRQSRGIIEASSEAKDYATEDLVTGMLSQHEKMKWMLESSLKQ